MATKPVMKFIATTREKLNTIPIKSGNLIFVIDDRAIYLDISDLERTTYQSIITVINEETRRNITSPIDGFYYVRESNTLYSYFDGTWQQLIGSDSNVIFVSSLPAEGQSDVLYILGDKIYSWNNTTNNYYIIGGGGSVDWENYTD